MIKQGLFTPWAQVLCYPCHGPTLLIDKEWQVIPPDAFRTLSEVVELGPDNTNEATVCDACGMPTLVLGRSDVAALHRMGAQMSAAEAAPAVKLRQTGGMCVALATPGDAAPILVITEDEEGPEGSFYIGCYADEDWADPLVDAIIVAEEGLIAAATGMLAVASRRLQQGPREEQA
jgi:hypothetical protein